MGCATSRIDDSPVVIRCKKRKLVMKQSVSYRQDFAIAHIAYIQALKSIGSALRRFAGADSTDEVPSPDSPTTPVPSFQRTASAARIPSPVAPTHSSPSHSPSRAAAAPTPFVAAAEASPPPPPAAAPSSAHTPAALASPSPSSTSPPVSLPSSSPVTSPPSRPPGSPAQVISRSLSMPPGHSDNRFTSPERSPMASPLYSPTREEDNFFRPFPTPVSLNPPPPPSPPQNYAWDYFDFFHPTPIPFHLPEQRGTKQVEEAVEEPRDSEQVREQEGIPALEDEEQEPDAIEQKAPKEEKREVQAEEKPVEKVPKESVEKMSEEKEPEIVTEEASGRTQEPIEEKEAAFNAEKVVVAEKEEDEKELNVPTSSAGKNLVDVVRHIDDQFIRAYTSGKEVAGMLETTKVHSHLSFSDFKDSVKVFNAITSHWSNKTPLASKDTDEDSDMAECGMAGSHASTLERLFAWEKKLYDEVKAGELIQIAFDRKCEQLRSQDAKGEDPTAIDKTRAAIKNLDTRLMVALRAVHSVSLRIQKLTNEELYPQLVEILGGLMNMWKVMLECHKIQKETASEMKSLENSTAGEEISEAHRKATVELETQLNKWQKCFSQWTDSQSSYIKSLYSWLTCCQLGPETNTKGRVVTSYKPEAPSVLSLIENWHKALERLKDHQEVTDALSLFSAAVHSLQLEQLEELRQKRRAEGFAKDLDRKTLVLQNMEKNNVERPLDSDEKDEHTGLRSTVRNTLQERGATLNNLKSKVEEEKQRHYKSVEDRRGTTLSSLKTNLPSIFEAMAAFTAVAVEEYEKLQEQSESSKLQPFQNGKLP